MPAHPAPRRFSSLEALESRIAPALIYGVDVANKLVVFDSAKTTVLLATHPITGLGAGEQVVGVDFRPFNGQLYAVTDLANQGHLYTIAPATGVASAVGGAFPLALDGTAFDIDFDPVADQLRLVSDHGQNFRLNPSTGSVIDGNSNVGGTQPDAALNFKTGDVNAGKTPAVTGLAYTNSFPGATTTQLFDFDRVLGVQTLQEPANSGTLATAGSLKVKPTATGGFDLLPGSKTGFADLVLAGSDQLYTVDITTGAAKLVGKIGPAGTHLASLAALPSGLGIVGKTATFRDVDGDLSTVTFTKGNVSPDIFTFSKPNALGGVVLQKLNLATAADGFSGAGVTFTAKISPLGGDGFVDVGRVDATNIDLLSLTVKGDLGSLTVGETVLNPAAIGTLKVNTLGAFDNFTQGGTGDNNVTINGDAGAFIATGDLLGLGTISISGAVKTITVTGGLYTTFKTGSVTVSAKFGGLVGSSFKSAGDLKKLTTGSVLASSIGSGGVIGSVAILGDFYSSQLTVQGHLDPTTAAQALALGSISITGTAYASQVLVGYSINSTAVNPDVQVGSVVIGGSWYQSSLAVGIQAGADAFFGNGNDASITPPAVAGQPAPVAGGSPAILARIASITVRGAVIGGSSTGDSFGFVANQIGAATIGGVKQPLTSGLDNLQLSSTHDVAIREYA